MNAKQDQPSSVSEDDERAWQVLESRMAFDNKWLPVRLERVKLPSGRVISDYYLWERGDAAVVVPITDDGLFIVTRQYKHGARAVVVEFPGGAVEPNEEPEAAAVRETLEETGYGIRDLKLISTLINDPTKERGRLYIYVAHGAVKIAQASPEITEDIETIVVSPAELRRLVDSGHMQTSCSVAAALLVLNNRR